jgi:hypothetical protein
MKRGLSSDSLEDGYFGFEITRRTPEFKEETSQDHVIVLASGELVSKHCRPKDILLEQNGPRLG